MKGLELMRKIEICVPFTDLPLGKFALGNWDYLQINSFLPGNFLPARIKSRVPFTNGPEFPEFFCKW